MPIMDATKKHAKWAFLNAECNIRYILVHLHDGFVIMERIDNELFTERNDELL